MILAGGKGTRLHPYTVALPKPLLPIGDKPILEILINQLKLNGFTRIVLAVNHQADIIQSYFGAGEKYGVEISYSLEKETLSTMAPLRLVPALPKEFLVLNGDVLTDLDFSEFFEAHINSGCDFTISAYKTFQESSFGVLGLDKDSCVIKFLEKPKSELIVSMGIYAMGSKALSMIPRSGPFGFDDLMRTGLSSDLNIRAQIHTGYWRDLGTPEEYQLANEEVNQEGTDRFIGVNVEK